MEISQDTYQKNGVPLITDRMHIDSLRESIRHISKVLTKYNLSPMESMGLRIADMELLDVVRALDIRFGGRRNV